MSAINFTQGSGLTAHVVQMVALLTVLSLAPSILVMMTSFTRIVVVLSPLRTSLGTATAPPNAVIVSSPGISLTVRCKAVEGSAEGNTISVLNEQSKRKLPGIIAAPGRLVVYSGSPQLAYYTRRTCN